MPTEQPTEEILVTGPVWDAPEAALTGFARKHGVSREKLVLEDLLEEKGRNRGHWYAPKTVGGRKTLDILSEELPKLILGIPFPKSMYWTAKSGPRFIRPIRWIVALLGNEVVPFEIAGVKSGNLTSGHRILGAEQIPVTIDNYVEKLRQNFVLSTAERRRRIENAIAELGLPVKPDADLLTTLVHLTEYPTVIQGSFDPVFLRLPTEVLVTVMRHHQKYFAVEDADGNLAPRFVAVTNTDGDPDGLIRRGNERVLRARFTTQDSSGKPTKGKNCGTE
jgi:glycyl-tRNA synthetase beta chain